MSSISATVQDMPTAAPRFQLHPHQQQSLRQLTEAWDQGYARVTLSLPCGTGKTVVMAGLLENLTAPSHRTVVLRLLVQTANILRAARPGARLIAVCNDRGATTDEFTPATAEERECEIDIEPADAAAELDTDITTDPERIAELLTQGGNNALVVATYASSAVVAAATELASITWDLLICDEAHRRNRRQGLGTPLRQQRTPLPPAPLRHRHHPRRRTRHRHRLRARPHRSPVDDLRRRLRPHHRTTEPA